MENLLYHSYSMELVKEKAFPANYSDSVLDILKRASLSGLKNVKVMGSASIRSQQYSGDYDAQDTVHIKSFESCAKDIQEVIKRVREDCYITDFKIGEVPEWDVVKGNLKEGLDFKLLESLTVLDKLKADKIISESEYKGAERMLRNVNSPLTFVEARKGIRFHILRWKPMEILDGIKTIRGYSIRLEDALASGGMVKLDLIASVAPSAEFTEFSVIYNLYMGKKSLTPIKTRAEIEEDLKEDIIYYNHRSPFKALKRAFSLAKMKNQYSEIAVLLPILNSDLGRLYQIVGDLESLHTLLEQGNPPLAEIRDNLSEMKARMGSIYSLKEFLDAEHSILGRIESMQRLQTIKTLKPAIYSLHTELQKILNEATLKKIYSIK
jgi:hypothetical protein